ncbi:MAG: hypothetical protein KKF01_01855, partial [Proteobacteria bacterium]|nr:hypothetical protein [Pseudomonadota bacterium]
SFLKHLEELHPVGIGKRLHDLDEFLHGLSPYIAIWLYTAETEHSQGNISKYSPRTMPTQGFKMVTKQRIFS